jgi:hypothetical protein
MKAKNFELTASLGLHQTSLEASLRAEIDEGGELGVVSRGGPAKVNAPLPVIGARTLWRVGENVYLDFLGQAFYLTIDEYDGSILNARVAITWQPKAFIGLGLGYDWFRMDIDADRPRFTGSMDWIYSGPQVFLSVTF